MNTFVKSFTHLKDRANADQALPLLQRIASLVKPIMRKHGWVLPVLSEFFPESPNLVDINGGQKILLRLRPAHAPGTFYDEEDIVHTMLHELTHNVHGPHDEKFYKFLAGLEEEYAALKRSGYAGEGFFSKGHRLGINVSHNLSPHLARQRAVEAAEKRRQVSTILGGGGRLGGARGAPTNKSARELAAEAAERRARDEKACASGAVAQREAEKAAKESVEDKVIDLTGGSDSDSDVEIVDGPSLALVAGPSKAAKRSLGKTSLPDRKRSRLAETALRSAGSLETDSGVTSSPNASAEWSCLQCTLANEVQSLQCVACNFARPKDVDPHRGNTPSVLDATPGEWTCPRCTLMNKPEVFDCAACDAPRPENSKSVQSVVDGWTCTVCGEAGMPQDF
ncbi:WLM-domain-containing protein [Daedalea quercina L-15889]|uniref:WLM-domain-containing protein n=1 Tax=Daedalea quercina L-15889 TaxID=1314783 RepID=A0A165TC96_9APHY|nr:WLM-domain-containing protein [Daedalea quercina L-15889]